MNKKALVVFLIILAFIFLQSMLPGDLSSQESSWIGENIINPVLHFLHLSDMNAFYVRKLAHITEFFFLGLAAGVVWRGKWTKSLYTGFTAAFLDESLQLLSADRGAMIADVWIDMIGVSLAVSIVHLIYRLIWRYRTGR